MGEKSARRAVERFDLRITMTEAYEDLYKKLVAGDRSRWGIMC